MLSDVAAGRSRHWVQSYCNLQVLAASQLDHLRVNDPSFDTDLRTQTQLRLAPCGAGDDYAGWSRYCTGKGTSTPANLAIQ
jgi:hypothetical protein